MWRKGKQVDCMLHTVRYHICCDMTPMPVHDEKAVERWISWPSKGFENGSQPLVCMGVGRPTAVTC